jgi:predicted nucleic acid-binding Zn ribbon protein
VTHPISITPDGVLFVAVKTHGWMTELSMMEPDLLRALNERTGNSKIVRIHWRLMRT